MATIGSLVVNIGANVGGLTQGLQDAQSRLRNFGSSLSSMGRSLSIGVTAPLVGIGVVALKSAGDFEQSMNMLQASTGATAGQMDALEAQALELGASTSFSAGEAAGAMLELAKAGMTVEQTSAAIAGVMDLAAAGGIDLASAATITANAINSFGLEASQATAVANTFAAAANASSADVGDLAQGFQMAGAVFAANGQTVDDLAVSLAILANNGIAGSDAGTSLKTMMMRLAAPTAEAAGAISDLGLKIYDSSGAMLPFGDIVAQLETATAGLSDEQRNAALSTIFGADAIRAATILADEGAAGFTAMEQAVGKQGAAQEMAAARMQGLNGAIEYLKGSIDSLLIGGAKPFLDVLNGWIRAGADLLTKFGTLSPEVQKWGVIAGVAAAAAGPLLMVLGAMASGLAALMSPITLVIAGVGLLAAAWATNFGGIQEKTAAVWAVVQPYLQQAVTWFQATLPGALASLHGWFVATWSGISGAVTGAQSSIGTAIDGIQGVWDNLVAIFEPAFQRIKDALGGLGESFAPLKPALEALGTAFGALWTAAQPIIQALGMAIGGVLGGVALVAIHGLASALEAIGPILTVLVGQVSLVVGTIATIITELVNLVTALINGDWRGAWQSAQNIMATFGAFVLGTMANLWSVLTEIWNAIKSTVLGVLDSLNVDGAAILESVKAWWKTKFEDLKNFVQPVIDVVNSVKSALQGVWDWLQDHVFKNPFSGWDFNPFNNGAPQVQGPAPQTSYPSRERPESGSNDFLNPGVRLPIGPDDIINQSMGPSSAAAGAVVIQQMNITQDLDWEEIRWRIEEMLARRGRR